ncbi:sensor histidine kinase [Allopusillimonas ginsengisoli]|uniref:sensor histidine kinase n=1 Tax=Allopusillimonas ginsengisoli TaxID=453575 RepID=UPI00101F342E|nr:sensor histidine kinase [Allopusillimonas ginsengisoli]TEA78173.1 sensor histidine kinase [Allopusillimonas ginsengisoli]
MVRLTRKPRGSMHFWLLVLLIPGTIALLLIDSWNDYKAVSKVTQQVYDSALLEPAKVLETSVEFNSDGSLRIDPPFYAQVMLESRAGNRKYFRVEEIDPPLLNLAGVAGQQINGRTMIGMRGLPRPPALADNESMPVFYTAIYRNDEVRMVALWRDLYYEGLHKQVLIMVGESVDMRLRTQQDAWRQGLFRDGRMLILAVLLVWFSVEWALRPLVELRREIKARDVDDLTPLDVEQVPREIVPLVRAVNHHIELYRQVLDKQAQFLADASHQLRTPLAIMRTQAQYAKREPDIGRVRESLEAIIRQLGQTSRLTEQLLSLAHASRKDVTPQARLDLNVLAREVVLQYLPLARERRQDLGWIDCRDNGGGISSGVWVLASDAEIHEAVANLVHNAINHAGDGSTITVSSGLEDDYAWISVCDNGVGLDPSFRESVFVRFDRGGPARKGARGSGSGLGLAIALAYAERNRGTIVLSDGDASPGGGVGLCAMLRLPRHKT